MIEYIPLSECEKGVIYKLRSRNLDSGVFDGKDGFIGIREKFGSRFLDTEYHRDTGPPHGTALPLERLGEVPEHPSIPLVEYLGSVDSRNGRPVDFDIPVRLGGRGWYYTDTDEEDQDIKSVAVPNANLFALLQEFTPGLALRLMTAEEWEDYFSRLEGPEGCNFRHEEGNTVWDCKGGMDKSFSEEILSNILGTQTMKIDGVLTYVEEFGGHCDCEVIFNAAERIREEIAREEASA